MKKVGLVEKIVICGLLFVSFSCLVVAVSRYQHKEEPTETVYIVYTDENSNPYAVQENPYTSPALRYVPIELTEGERDTVARIIAGKAGNVPVSTQLIVANVIRNDYVYCGRNLDEAIKEFHLGSYAEPTQDNYDVVDAVFERAELSVDDDVLWMNDTYHHSAFHDELEMVCSYHGISFYKEG